jgi:SAM-dependent methyltransferase
VSQSVIISETSEQYVNAVVDTAPSPSFFRYILPLTRGKKVLDIGSGTGQYLVHFNTESVGLDISLPNLIRCRGKGLNVRRSDFNVRLECADQEFEMVFCSHVLEHVDAPINLLRECNRCLIDEGRLIIGVPTAKSIVRLFRDRYFYDHPEHLYAFSIENLTWLLLNTGFTVERIFIDLRKVKQWHLTLFLDLCQKLPPWSTLWFSNGYWMVAQKSFKRIIE